MQNMFSNLAPSGGGDNSGTPWYMRYAGKGVGILAGCMAVFFGIWCCVSFSLICIVAGVWQIIAGLFVITIEAPFCAKFIPILQKFVDMIEGRPIWQKALLYLAISLLPMFMCANYTTIIGSGMIFVTATIFGLMSLGSKASREEMAFAASGTPEHQQSGLVGKIGSQDIEASKAAI